MFEEYNKKNFIKKVTKYNNIDGVKLYNIEYIYDKSKVINKVKKIYNHLEQIIQIEEYNVDYSLHQQQPIDLLMKVTKYKNLNNISSIIEYIYDNKSKKVINKNVNIYNDSGKLLSKESYNIIDGSDIPSCIYSQLILIFLVLNMQDGMSELNVYVHIHVCIHIYR
ncbi:MAG: hypothetical protein Q8842_02305 [Candidatus Phytoplasma australasiaticum]|nr:hypothetical protein [Candidatus Phytoplasma australasiaticum]